MARWPDDGMGLDRSHSIAPPPRWAVVSAVVVPLAIAPSAIWRTSLLFGSGDPGRAVLQGGWYLLTLSVVSLGLGLLTIGLVRPWGIVFPGWMPVLGGRLVPARAAAATAIIGGGCVIALIAYLALNRTLGLFHPRPLIPSGFVTELDLPSPWVLAALYGPMLAWGPLVIIVAVNYLHRRTRSDAGRCRPVR